MKKWLLPLVLLAMLPAWAGQEWVNANVVKLDAARGKVTLEHAPIRSIWMETMTMPFKVKDVAQLGSLKVGDKVRFTVREDDGELVVQQIEARR